MDRPVDRHRELVARLRQLLQRGSADDPQGAGPVELIETHISSVLLAGGIALKLKKPVDLGFVDFTALASRRRACEEELRLNRRTAPRLYLDVVAIRGSIEAPTIDGHGPAIDYAVRMHRFADDALFDHLARSGALTQRHVDRLACTLAGFHDAAAALPTGAPWGEPAQSIAALRELGARLHVLVREFPGDRADRQRDLARLDEACAWVVASYEQHAPLLAARRAAGRVRECHGDLHLGNIAWIDEQPVPFDAIEFDPALRWIDTLADAAFVKMDLLDHGLAALAWRFVNGYLDASGDHDGLPLLRAMTGQRALVRTLVAGLRAQVPHTPPAEAARLRATARRTLALAETLGRPPSPLLVVTTGLSGAGKTTVTQGLLERLSAVRLRSDVERKRLYGLAPAARGSGAIYDPAANRRTYERLALLAELGLAAGHRVIVDAACLQRAERAALLEVARRREVPGVLLACEAPMAVLQARVAQRFAAARDASDATLEVLARQCAAREPLDASERAHARTIDTDTDRAGLDGAIALAARRIEADLAPTEALI